MISSITTICRRISKQPHVQISFLVNGYFETITDTYYNSFIMIYYEYVRIIYSSYKRDVYYSVRMCIYVKAPHSNPLP